MQKVLVFRLGTRDYKEVWDLQTRLHDFLVRRKRGLLSENEVGRFPENCHFLLLCDHPPVYTLGKSGHINHLRLSEQELHHQQFQFYKINRGGDITYHGPGQLIAYPIFDLESFFTDVHRYVRTLEEAIIKTLADFKISSYRDPSYTGVWVKFNEPPIQRKICAIGVHLSRWVSMHGLAFNVCPDLEHFRNIIPCGIQDDQRDVCSMAQLLPEMPNIPEVENTFLRHFGFLMEAEMETVNDQSVLASLAI
jgi:lipoyl(octanoyl) transferase